MNIHECDDISINNMQLKMCEDLKEYERVDFTDFTGENVVRLKEGKIFRNHGHYVALFKNNTLYVGKEMYDLSKWQQLKNKFK
jgi:formylmethanofuran dehydrogenase subunit A